MKVIEVGQLAKSYAGRPAVRDVSFEVEEGEIFGVLGPNGAGKTTTVECVSGLRAPDAGRIRVLGADPQRDRAVVRESVGVQVQQAELPELLRVGEALRMFAAFYPHPADPAELIDTLGLAGSVSKPWKALSGGQKQRLSIALALVGNPRIAILDELTTGLDPAARQETWGLIEAIRDRGTTILLVTHFMPEAERLCDRLAVIDEGRVVALDTPAGIVAAAGSGQAMRFRLSEPIDERLLSTLPEVGELTRTGEHYHLRGTDDLVAAVTSTLARHGVVAQQLRVEQASLDDAFVAITHPVQSVRKESLR
jgi:ABC-2 type transport system ATP-binding protein